MANAPVLKTGDRKVLGVRIPRPPFYAAMSYDDSRVSCLRSFALGVSLGVSESEFRAQNRVDCEGEVGRRLPPLSLLPYSGHAKASTPCVLTVQMLNDPKSDSSSDDAHRYAGDDIRRSLGPVVRRNQPEGFETER